MTSLPAWAIAGFLALPLGAIACALATRVAAGSRYELLFQFLFLPTLAAVGLATWYCHSGDARHRHPLGNDADRDGAARGHRPSPHSRTGDSHIAGIPPLAQVTKSTRASGRKANPAFASSKRRAAERPAKPEKDSLSARPSAETNSKDRGSEVRDRRGCGSAAHARLTFAICPPALSLFDLGGKTMRTTLFAASLRVGGAGSDHTRRGPIDSRQGHRAGDRQPAQDQRPIARLSHRREVQGRRRRLVRHRHQPAAAATRPCGSRSKWTASTRSSTT